MWSSLLWKKHKQKKRCPNTSLHIYPKLSKCWNLALCRQFIAMWFLNNHRAWGNYSICRIQIRLRPIVIPIIFWIKDLFSVSLEPDLQLLLHYFFHDLTTHYPYSLHLHIAHIHQVFAGGGNCCEDVLGKEEMVWYSYGKEWSKLVSYS